MTPRLETIVIILGNIEAPPIVCHLRYKIPHYISIVFHNLSGYDAHLFIREFGKKFDTGKIGVIAEN